MAGQPPDPRTLNSWEDAFQHPLPVVRKLEQQLRKHIDDNRQKLRSLVGASYRDLLGTAEKIIEMDEQVQTIETSLGKIGKNCNARAVERITENHMRMRRARGVVMAEGERFGVLAQTKVLQSSLVAAGRIVKAGGRALQAAKLFVLARLLCKSVGESEEAPSVLPELRRRLNGLRARLLGYIERSMVVLSVEKMQLGQTLCAYALVTSSSSKEVLRHFLQIRYDQLENKTDSPSDVDMLQMLDLYSQTLSDTRELFPRRLAEALSQLSKIPLLQDEMITSVSELNIDIYKSWIAEDIRTFTPWIRHDQLVDSEVGEALAAWTRQAQTCLLSGLHNYLQSRDSARDVLQSRQQFLSKFIALSGRLRSATSASAIQDLRVAFSTRLEELAVQAASIVDLTLAEADVEEMMKSATKESTMWDLATETAGLSNGASLLRRAILNKRHGRDTNMEGEARKLDEWLQRIHNFLDIADEMSLSKWDDDLDFDLEDLEGEESLQQMLSKDDPEQLRQRVRDAIASSLQQVITRISSSAEETKYAPFHLRLWREISLRRRGLETRLALPATPISLVQLHRNIARSVTEEVVQSYILAAKQRTRPAVTLWDGTPALPIQPSPAVFRFLTSLHKGMAGEGADLWSSRCVAELKGLVGEILGRELGDEGLVNPSSGVVVKGGLTNGHVVEDGDGEEGEKEEEAEESADGKKEAEGNADEKKTESEDVSTRLQLVQNLFDVYYLSRVLGRTGALDGLAEKMRGRLELDGVADGRLKKSAGDYWKRTYLLFGLLAPDDVVVGKE